MADSGLTLEYIAEKNVRVLGDADMIRQATANLISNAVRYTPEGGHHHGARVKTGDLMAAIAVQRHRHRAFARGSQDGVLAASGAPTPGATAKAAAWASGWPW